MKHRFLFAWIFVAACIAFTSGSVFGQNQGKVPAPKESRPANPTVLEWHPNVNPDAIFYQLASDQRIEDKSSTIWTFPTLGFREIRMVAFMTESDKTSKVAPPSLRISLIIKDGDKELEITNKNISVETGAGRSSGDAFFFPVYSDNAVIKVEPKNMNGKLHLSAYLMK
ncbi:MAG: hypothetical protein K1Y36_09205 [Blastocatellia bacterium]|nr:hypothetical protein [Blastocatellia bacterium]